MPTARVFIPLVLLLGLASINWWPEAAPAACAGLQLNELDYDQPGTDTQEFIEMAGPPGLTLAGLELRLVNGLNGAVYHSQALTGTMPVDGYLVIGAAGVPGLDIVLDHGGSNLIQNGAPDGLGLWDLAGGVYCDFVNYEGSVQGFGSWPEIGQDTPGTCGTGTSASLARRETSQPLGEWVSGACASPGMPNEGPTAVVLSAFRATPAPDPDARLAVVLILLAFLQAARFLRSGRIGR